MKYSCTLAGVFRQHYLRRAPFTASVVAFQSEPPSISSPSVPDKNALLRIIKQHILASGPIPIPIWMNFCLNHPSLGYYSRTDRGLEKRHDPFGKTGDFITSPEITQLIAIWFISRWQAAKCPPRIRIIELGPGRGTLMADIIRTIRSLKACKDVEISINLVENSLFMREIQNKTLNQHHTKFNKIEWFDRIEQVGKADDQWSMIIAHEFFDALPIHIFQKTEMGFREVMVDINDPNPDHRSTKALLSSSSSSEQSSSLRFVLSPGPTLASQTLISKEPHHQKLPIGSKLEISPSSHQIAQSLSLLLLKSHLGGSGLVIDYGDDHLFSNSLRGFSDHQIVDPLFLPGLTDITSNVDFSSLKRSMDSNVKTYGPITQREFLLSMGIEVRTNLLKKSPKLGSSDSIDLSSRRLVSPFGMGHQYKFLGFEANSHRLDKHDVDDDEVYPFPKNT